MLRSYSFLLLLYLRFRFQFSGTCPGLEMFLYRIGWPHIRNVFTCVGTETLLLNFFWKEVKHLISVAWWQYTVSLRVRVCWKRTSNSATGGNIWFLLDVCVCDELIPKSEIERFFQLQQPMFKRRFLQMTFDKKSDDGAFKIKFCANEERTQSRGQFAWPVVIMKFSLTP